MRLMSILLPGISLFILNILASELQIKKLFAGILIIHTAINPVFARDALLIRGYMLALCGCLLSVLYLWKILSGEKIRMNHVLLYFLGMILATGSHYYTVCLFLSQAMLIGWKMLSNKGIRFFFLIGYGLMMLICLCWIWVSYPRGLSNLLFFHNRLGLISKDTGYAISPVNYLKQLLLYATSIIGLNSGSIAIRIIMKTFCGGVLLAMVVFMFKKRFSLKSQFIMTITLLPLITYSVQSVIVGQYTNFIPHYLVFFIPFWMLGLYLMIEENVNRRKLISF